VKDAAEPTCRAQWLSHDLAGMVNGDGGKETKGMMGTIGESSHHVGCMYVSPPLTLDHINFI